MSQFSKKWEDLTIADNFIFCKVMENESLCKELLEILLGIKIEKINYIKRLKRQPPTLYLEENVISSTTNNIFHQV